MKASDVLRDWFADVDPADMLRTDVDGLIEMPLSQAGAFVDVQGAFDESCRVVVDPARDPDGQRVILKQIAGGKPRSGLKLCLLKTGREIRLHIRADDNRVFIGAFGYGLTIEAFLIERAQLVVGDAVTCNGARMALVNSSIQIGQDSMISDEVILQSSDQHGIVDLKSGRIVNDRPTSITIGRHVWIGRRALLMPNCRIGDGAIIGAGSTVTGAVEGRAIHAGVPARLVRADTSWSRSRTTISPEEAAFFGEGG